MMKTKNKSFLSRLFSHNITLFILAFLITFSAWFTIKITSGEETPKTIKNIPITVELPESVKNEGYVIFGLNQDSGSEDDESYGITATVDVSGNPIVVAGLSASDIKVSASQTTTIVNPGTYTLPLTAKKASLKSDYDFSIDNLSPATVTVYVDTEKEETFTIDNNMTVQLKDTNHYADVKLSDESVKISGPATQVNKIASVGVEGTISGETTTTQQSIIYYDANGDKLDLSYITTDVETVEVSVTVQPVKTVNLKVDVTNAPDDYPEIKLEPSTLKIAGPQSTLDNIEDNTISIKTIDFSQLKNEDNQIECDITLPDGCKSTEKNITKATASIDLSDYYSTTITAKVKSSLDSSKYTTVFVSSEYVELTVYGPYSMVSELSSSDVTVTTDFSNLPKNMSSGDSVNLNIPLTATLSKTMKQECWVYEPPTISVNITKK